MSSQTVLHLSAGPGSLYNVDIWCYSWPKHIMCWDSSSHYSLYFYIGYELHASELLCCISRSLDEIRAEWQTADRGIYTTANTSLCKHPLISLQPASFSLSFPTSCFRRSCLWFLKPRIRGKRLIPLCSGIVMMQINWPWWERTSVSVCLCVIHTQCQWSPLGSYIWYIQSGTQTAAVDAPHQCYVWPDCRQQRTRSVQLSPTIDDYWLLTADFCRRLSSPPLTELLWSHSDSHRKEEQKQSWGR